jgi:hypothetical protein
MVGFLRVPEYLALDHAVGPGRSFVLAQVFRTGIHRTGPQRHQR